MTSKTQTQNSLPWWRTDTYEVDAPVVADFVDFAGPQGVALVRAWPDGRTDKGWGLQPPKGESDGFITRYMRDDFNARRVTFGFNKGRWAFAIVMRSVNLVCIDIDGKNGGLEHAKRLGLLPPTLAETSKSGDGYHLFYSVEDDWDPTKGYGRLADRIGIEQGVDVRATGCVYHHAQQRWNTRRVAALPEHLYQLLASRDQKIAATRDRIVKVLTNEDEVEIMMLHDELLSELKKPIPTGKRNNTLFAIGSQMQEAQVPDWEQAVTDRAIQIGLDSDEIEKLINNIERYAPAAP